MGDGLPERWEPSPPSPRAVEEAEEKALGAGAGALAASQPTREVTSTAVAPARAADMTGGAAVATSAAATMPSRRGRGSKDSPP
jgi:hypothetical protein